MQVIAVFLQQYLKFLHEETADEFIFPFFEQIETIKINLASDFPYNIRIDAWHVNLKL